MSAKHMTTDGNGATAELARFAAGLAYDHLPAPVVARAKDCLIDALGCVVFGVTLPWTRMLIELVEQEGGNRRASIPGTRVKTSVSQAVLVPPPPAMASRWTTFTGPRTCIAARSPYRWRWRSRKQRG